MSQLELFSSSDSLKQKRPEKSFFGHIKGHEKGLLITIAVIITAIVSFSLGVERGKKLIPQDQPLLAQNSVSMPAGQVQAAQTPASVPGRLPAVQATETQASPAVALTPAVSQDTTTVKPAVVTSSENDKLPAGTRYTIQLASYQTGKHAQSELTRLKGKGYQTILITKGSYKILCVGSYPSREKAMPALSELKRQYRDCFIRRL